MRTHWVHVEHDFDKPVEKVFAFLGEHENLTKIFPAKITRLSDGNDGHRNGVGSARKMRIGILAPFIETVTEYVPNERVVYRITKGTPLRGHEGTMRFSPTPGGGTHLDYKIRLASPIPGLAAVMQKALTASVKKGLPAVDREA